MICAPSIGLDWKLGEFCRLADLENFAKRKKNPTDGAIFANSITPRLDCIFLSFQIQTYDCLFDAENFSKTLLFARFAHKCNVEK